MKTPDTIERLNAALEGRYQVEREIGEGGMATVFLAKDLKHNRNVALKVLKPELAAVVGAERFLAEIETTANLQHPHILPLFDSGEAGSFLFYVMPYVEGETLRDRLDKDHQLPVADAVQIATNVAEALDYAHSQGVIHRDIKPANILLQAGKPVISDFGIALAVGAAGGGRLTETGLSLGTPHYMSPEQATGDLSVGAATDIYALGCVLYEMLVGEPPYTGSTAQAILGKIITGDVASATEARASVPVHVDAAIRKALEKVPADRFAGVQEFARALADPGFRHGELATAEIAGGAGPWKWLTVGFASLAALMTLAFGWALLRPEPSLSIAQFDVTPPDESAFTTETYGRTVGISPDGQRMVYVGPGPQGDGSQLWQRAFSDDLEPTPIAGTEGGTNPVFSPDGLSLAFNDADGLKTVSLLRGIVFAVATGPASFYLDWGEDGMLYFGDVGPNDRRVTFKVPATGGQPEQVTDPVEGVEWVTIPEALPEGRGLLVTLRRALPSEATVGVVGPDGGAVRELFPGMSARYAASGHIVYATADNTLMAAPFDLSSLEVTGPHVGLLEGVAIRSPGLMAHFSLSETGTLLYRTAERAGSGLAGRRLATVDFEGNIQALALGPRRMNSVSWSPDGESVVYSSDDQIYTYNVVLRTQPRQLTFEGTNLYPAFSPDGTRIAFQSDRPNTEGYDLFVKNLNDDTQPRTILTLAGTQRLTQWPSDSLIVFEHGENGSRDLWMVDFSDPENPQAGEYLSSEFDLRFMVVSPDRTLAAYSSNESGQIELYVRSFPEPGGPTPVSQDGGQIPFWSPDGDNLHYATLGEPWMTARLQRNPVPVVLSVEELFGELPRGQTPFQGAGLHPDGDRFILALPTSAARGETHRPDRLVLVQNFFEELKRLVPN